MVLMTAREAEGSLPHTVCLACFLPGSCQGMEKFFFLEASDPYFCKRFPLSDPYELLPISGERQLKHFLMWKEKNRRKPLNLAVCGATERSNFLSKQHVLLYALKN